MKLVYYSLIFFDIEHLFNHSNNPQKTENIQILKYCFTFSNKFHPFACGNFSGTKLLDRIKRIYPFEKKYISNISKYIWNFFTCVNEVIFLSLEMDKQKRVKGGGGRRYKNQKINLVSSEHFNIQYLYFMFFEKL